jgi:putative alpha-1,2-mannosidase
MGHCYPGATVPFGLVQLSPDTETADYSRDGKTYDPAVYRYCALLERVKHNP